MGHLDGQSAVVTGTAQGIGRAIADLLESEGAAVHRVDKDTVDPRHPAAVDAFFAALGELHILVNDAGGVHVLSNPTTQAQWDSYGADGQRALLERIAMRKAGQPSDIARGVLFFAAPDAGRVSGQTISINGGHSLF